LEYSFAVLLYSFIFGIGEVILFILTVVIDFIEEY
jgi:hypothetical protein